MRYVLINKNSHSAKCRSRRLLTALAVCGVFSGYTASIPASPPRLETRLRIEWLGAERIASDTNAVTSLRILSLPESVALKEQTLEKLSRAPWTLLPRQTDTNASALVRPLLDDLFRQEVRFELAGITNQPSAFALAVRLNGQRSALWETNLAVVLDSLNGSSPKPLAKDRPGWAVRQGEGQPIFVFTRAKGWTVYGAAGDLPSFDLLTRRLLESDSAESANHASKVWLTASLDLPRLLSKPDLLGQLPRLHLKIFGQAGRTRTEVRLDFAEPLDSDMPEWDIPTHLIDQPCSSLAICRGLPRMLASLQAWSDLKIGPTPDQFFVWASQGQFMHTYFLLDVPDPTNLVQQATESVMRMQGDWFGSNDLGGFRRSATADGFEWNGLPYLWPFLRTFATNGNAYVLGGMWTWLPLTDPLSSDFFDNALNQGEVVYYDWERTDQRIPQWLFMTQFARHVSNRPQLGFESAALLWLKAIASEMADCITRIELTGPNQLTLLRTSDLGLTAIELHLLADWLESPTFPRGLHTFTAPPPKPLDGGE